MIAMLLLNTSLYDGSSLDISLWDKSTLRRWIFARYLLSDEFLLGILLYGGSLPDIPTVGYNLLLELVDAYFSCSAAIFEGNACGNSRRLADTANRRHYSI